ncbi:HEAT repeat domain-containing protein [Vibrio sp. F74]|uniref:HEAT repeat domain-containing protein n=1 Tax=Vibrio sp. F74 TaxID=700020 RepID=UPI0035F5D4C2
MQVTETHCPTVDMPKNKNSTPISTLVELLNSGDEAQRCYSARALSPNSLTPDTLPLVEAVLNDNLYHEDPDVVVDSATALARLSIGDEIRLIEVATLHPEADARLAALDALENLIENPKVEALFIELAKGRAAEDSWGSNSDWDDWWDIQLKAVASLTKYSKPEFVATFKQILDLDPEPELESKLYQGIVRHDVSWVIDQLSTSSSASKRKLVKSLTFSEESIATVFLFKQLRSEDAAIRKLSIEGIAQKAASEYFWDIVNCLQDSDFSVQKAATIALTQFSLASDIDQDRLINYIERAEINTRPLLFELLSNSGALTEENTYRVLELLVVSTSHSLLNITNLLLVSTLTDAQIETLLELYKNAMRSSESDTASLTALIRQASKINGYEKSLLTALQNYITRIDEQTLECQYNVSIRQAAYDALAGSEYPACKQLIKNALFGVDAYANPIDVEVVESPDELDVLEETQSEVELASLLSQYEAKIDTPLNVVNTPNSTLGAIQQANIESELTPDKDEPEQQQRIVEMVEGLDSELEEYAQLVKDNFDSAEKLDLNRRKIAKLPSLSNKILALKSLGLSNSEESAQWLVDSVLGAQPNELREIFQSLKRIKMARPESKEVNNGLGAAGNSVYHGDDLTKQSAISLLANMPASKAIPLLLYALTDKNEHVRLCSLTSLEAHMSKVKQNQREAVSFVINKCLMDPSSGVKKQALKLAALNSNKVDISLTTLIEVAINDEACLKAAEVVLSEDECNAEAIDILASRLLSLRDHHQPNAIKLMGALMV